MDGPGGRPAKGAHATLIVASLVCGKALAQLAVAPGGTDVGWDPSTSVTWREVENFIKSDKPGGLR